MLFVWTRKVCIMLFVSVIINIKTLKQTLINLSQGANRGHIAKVCRSVKATAHSLRQEAKWVKTQPLESEETKEE